MLRLAFFALFFAACVPAAPPLLVIALDGYRHDWVDRAPVLRRLAAKGARVQRLEPVFPSTTFPNFHSMGTGLEPLRHGLVAMEFYDPGLKERFSYRRNGREGQKWYRGKPFWEVAQEAGIRTGTFFWVGSDAGVNGKFPSTYRVYDPAVTHEEKIRETLRWLREGYGLAVVYFPDVDAAGHSHGPDSPEVAAAIANVDASMARLLQEARRVVGGLNVLVVSDHGMSKVERVLDLSGAADFSGCLAANEGPMTRLYCRDEGAVARVERELRRKEEEIMVRRGEGRSGDLILIPRCRCIVNILIDGDDAGAVPALRGMHGYPPEKNDEMYGILLGAGPAFRRGAVIPLARAPDVYAVILGALGLNLPPDLDARPDRVQGLFARAPQWCSESGPKAPCHTPPSRARR